MEGEAGGSPSIARERVRSWPRPIGHVWAYLVEVCCTYGEAAVSPAPGDERFSLTAHPWMQVGPWENSP